MDGPVSTTLSADEHEFQFNPQRAFPDFARHQQRREPVNATALAWPGRRVDLAYGQGRLQTVDLYAAQPEAALPEAALPDAALPGTDLPEAGKSPEAGAALAPRSPRQVPPALHLFFHGGYWRQQDKANFAFIGAALARRGVTALVANYDLCPAVTLDGVVDSALACFEWVCRHGGDLGGDPARLSLSGHSAGAHLVAEILATDWSTRGIDASVVTGATLISGIFDPTPAIRTTVNAELHLDQALARRHDVERRPPTIDCPTSILVGGQEPERWIEQSFRYSQHLRRHGQDPAVHVVPGRDHFDIIDDYLDNDSLLMQDLTALAGLTGPSAVAGRGRR